MFSKILNLPLFFNGLTTPQVEKSRKKYGKNIITQKKKKGFWQKYLASFGDPIIRILLIALSINVLMLFRHSNWLEPMFIAIAVLVATFVSTISEYGSEAAFEKLQAESQELTARVKRNNKLVILPAKELVVGDIVLLQAGEKIPADGHLVWGELTVDQSALNGEAKEARKFFTSGIMPKNDLSCPLSLFNGSVIFGGDGVMEVKKVGDNTFYGQLAAEIQVETKKSPLKERLTTLANRISRFGYITATIILISSLFRSFVIESNFDPALITERFSDMQFVTQTLMNSIIIALSVLVMCVPEGLPMMITVVLSANMRKMLKKNVLVRKLVGIETAGSLNILFTDKTGTLTIGKLQVATFVSGEKTYDVKAGLSDSELKLRMLTACVYNNDSHILDDGRQRVAGGNSTDRALLEFAMRINATITDAELINHIPFNSKDKYSMSEIKWKGKEKHLIKGAPEIILKRCKHYLDENGEKHPLDIHSISAKLSVMAKSALRMLALAESDGAIDMNSPNPSLTLIGLLGIRDEIRKESAPAIEEITNAGIQTVMLTGDNKETAVAIAKEIGLIKGETENGVYTSEQLARLSDNEIKRILTSMRVVARAMPTDKSRLVRLAQEMDMVVGMTGDGINDAPALKNADVGIAMGTGTEVAKEASGIVILDNNISSIVQAILYGRTIFKSIRKYLVFRLAINFCAVALVIVCPFLSVDVPLTVMQMLWVNMIIDALAGIAFAGEPPLKEYMLEPPKTRDEEIISPKMYKQIALAGGYITLLSLLFLKLTFFQNIFRFQDGTNYFMTAFFTTFILTGVFNSFNTRTERINLLAGLHANPLFVVTMLTVCVIQIILIMFGGDAFRTTTLSFDHLMLTIALATSIIPVDITRKIIIKKASKRFGKQKKKKV